MPKKVLVMLVSAVAFLALCEGAARVVLSRLEPAEAPLVLRWEGPEQEADLQQTLYQADEATFFRLRPNLALSTTASPRLVDVRTNSAGLRGPEVAPAKPAGTLRILCVGDSCTFGSGAKTAEAFPARLEARLRQRLADRNVEVVNAGTPGFSSFQGLRFLEDSGFDLDPDLVLFTLGINDTTPAKPGPKRRFEHDLFVSDAEYAELLAKRASDWALVRLARRLGAGSNDEETRAQARARLRAASDKVRVSIDEYAANLERMIAACRDRGVIPVVATWPTRRQAQGLELVERGALIAGYQAHAIDTATRLKSPHVDLVPAMRGHADEYIDDVHLNPRGYDRIAEALARELEELVGG